MYAEPLHILLYECPDCKKKTKHIVFVQYEDKKQYVIRFICLDTCCNSKRTQTFRKVV